MKTENWRQASTVILVDNQSASAARVLMLRRPESMRVFAGVWVFPGGAVELSDRSDDWRARVSPSVDILADKMVYRDRTATLMTPDDYLQAMRVPTPGPSAGWLPGVVRETLFGFWIAAIRELYEETGIRLAGWPNELNLSRVRYIGRLAPPPDVPHRFDTRFFLTRVSPGDLNLSLQEADDARWLTPQEALSGEYKLALPTRYTLQCLSQFAGDDKI